VAIRNRDLGQLEKIERGFDDGEIVGAGEILSDDKGKGKGGVESGSVESLGVVETEERDLYL